MQDPALKNRVRLQMYASDGMAEAVGGLDTVPRVQPMRGAQHRVAQACFADALDAFGLSGVAHRLGRRLAGRLLAAPVQRLARRMLTFDEIVAEHGLQAGGAYAVSRLTRGVTVQGQCGVPRKGPLLLVANHPGLADAAALFAQLPREDVRVIAAPRRLLAALPAVRQRLITVPEQGRNRLSAVRSATRHMQAGGAILTFPGGRIEPDPAVRSGAVDALAHWSGCMDLFARRVPGLPIVPVAVRGVLSPAALEHPLTRLRRDVRDRDWLAATLQMLDDEPADVTPEVLFGAPIRADDPDIGQSVRSAVLAAMQALLETPLAGTSSVARGSRPQPGRG